MKPSSDQAQLTHDFVLTSTGKPELLAESPWPASFPPPPPQRIAPELRKVRRGVTMERLNLIAQTWVEASKECVYAEEQLRAAESRVAACQRVISEAERELLESVGANKPLRCIANTGQGPRTRGSARRPAPDRRMRHQGP